MTTIQFPVRPLQPGGYSRIDLSGLANANSRAGAPVPGLIGDAKGGIPNTVQRFTDAQAAATVLRSGPLADIVRSAFLGGASTVLAVRAGAGALPASSALLGATASPVTLTAKDYGVWTNQIKRTVGANNKITVTFTDVFGTTFTEVFDAGVSATPQDVVDAINGAKPGVSGSAFVTAAVTTGTMPLTASASANLTAGADAGTLQAADWTNALKVLEPEDVDFIGVATGDATVHAQVLTHCNAMSAVLARRERRTVVGGVIGEVSATTAAARCAAIRSPRLKVTGPGIYLPDTDGSSKLWAPYCAAAFTIGRHCAQPDPATSLVHQVLDGVTDVEARWSTIPGGDLDILLAAGFSPIAVADGNRGIWWVDDLSTYQGALDITDFHKIGTADESAKRMRRRLEDKFVGGKTLNASVGEIALEALSELQDQFSAKLIRDFGRPTVTENPDHKGFLINSPIVLPDTTKFILLTTSLQAPLPSVAAADTVV